MKMVICGNYDCLYCDGQYKCQKDVISVGEEYSYGCDDYISYLDTDEYKETFFKAVKTKDGIPGRAKETGKKIEYNGRAFYTTDKLWGDESYSITDERTGLLIANIAWIKDNWEKFLETEKKFPDINTYPLAVLKGDKYVLAEKGGEEDA